ncbi:C-C motif chemokine 20-like [Hyperolius riggenbachi]|uniref:C-C motif chemokine 20-like n=1 Tax=Hyperolius riggenbachi TaxID=752182 RepID=UPI0035A2856C
MCIMSRVSYLFCVSCILLLGLQSLNEAAVFDCCYSYTKKPLPLKMIRSYTNQYSYEVCDIDAVILITQRFRVCANPKDQWVKRIVPVLRQRKARLQEAARNSSVVSTN